MTEEIAHLKQTISLKEQRLITYQEKLNAQGMSIRQTESQISIRDIDLRKIKHQIRKVQSLASNPPSGNDTQQLSKLAYKEKVAKNSYSKTERQLDALFNQQRNTLTRLQRLTNLLDDLNAELNHKQTLYNNSMQVVAVQQKAAKAKRLATQKATQKAAQKQAQARKQEEKQKQQAMTQQKQLNADKKRRDEALALLQKIANMPQAEAALTRAEYIAKQDKKAEAVFGNSVTLYISKPIGSTPVAIAQLQHLGNNQYSANINVKKGLQRYSVGDFTFEKSIPKSLHGSRCLILIDARDTNVQFQIIKQRKPR
ncbi:MAG: hypothetical protein HRU20_07475 [Pseudomonadales bacterium]|nr:hypothetical protein [Pseudomonadales bacterium]